MWQVDIVGSLVSRGKNAKGSLFLKNERNSCFTEGGWKDLTSDAWPLWQLTLFMIPSFMVYFTGVWGEAWKARKGDSLF